MNQSVIVLGYSTRLSGGVTKVSGYLLSQMDELELHPVLGCYYPFLNSLFFTCRSLASYTWKLIRNRKNYGGVIVIIASSGDVIRTLPFIWVSLVFGIKTFSQFHTNSSILQNIWNNSFLRYMVASTWKSFSYHTFLSESLETEFQSFTGARDNGVVIPNAIDRKWLNTTPISYSERTRDIVYFGRWAEEKGINDLVRAMGKIGNNTVCEIYSDPPSGVSYENCQLFPWVSENEVYEIMRSSRLVVLPSYKEAYPTVLLEAVACRTPFIATNVGGIPDIAKKSGCGLLVEPGDIARLVMLIQQLLGDEDNWKKYSETESSWIHSHDINDIARKWRSLF